MYKYEMDPTKIVGATEWTQDAGRTDGRMDRRTDRRIEWNQYTPNNFVVGGGGGGGIITWPSSDVNCVVITREKNSHLRMADPAAA